MGVDHGQGEFTPSSGAGLAVRRGRRIAACRSAALRDQHQHGGADRSAAGGARDARAAQAGAAAGRGKLAPDVGFLVEIVEAVPDISLEELAAALFAEHGVKVHPASISRVLTKADLTYKKSRCTPPSASARTSAPIAARG